MVWDFGDKTKGDLIASLREQAKNNATVDLKASSVVGKNLWMLLSDKADPSKVSITLCKMDQSKHLGHAQWGYRAIDESSFPFEFDCPLKYIEASTNERGAPWREYARIEQENSELIKNLIKPELKVSIGSDEYTVISSLGAKGWRVRNKEGVDMRMPSKTAKEQVAAIFYEAGRAIYDSVMASPDFTGPLHWRDEHYIPVDFDRLGTARSYFINRALGGNEWATAKYVLQTDEFEIEFQQRRRQNTTDRAAG